jgi:uridine phosphorylase
MSASWSVEKPGRQELSHEGLAQARRRVVTADHLGLGEGQAQVAIVTGDPARVPVIGEIFGARHVSSARGFVCHVAADWQRPLAIVSTGIGGPATAIVVEELVELGVQCVIRVGTCGALQPQIRPDDLVVPIACVRDDGTSASYIDRAYPAVADPDLAHQLFHAAREQGGRVHRGITHCKDAYYSERPDKQPDPERMGRRWRTLRAAHVLATEMEASPLFVIGSLRRVPTAAVLINVGAGTSPGFGEALALAVRACARALTTVRQEGAPEPAAPRSDASESYLHQPPPGEGEPAS